MFRNVTINNYHVITILFLTSRRQNLKMWTSGLYKFSSISEKVDLGPLQNVVEKHVIIKKYALITSHLMYYAFKIYNYMLNDNKSS